MNEDQELALSIDPELDPDEAEAVGRYMRRQRYRSDFFRVGRTELYRNKGGRCEDAPCCGCCNV